MAEINKNKDNAGSIPEQRRGSLVVVSAFSGSGKGAVLKELFKIAEYKYSISATTRAPRNGEVNGVDYYFLSKEVFTEKIRNGELLEYVEYSGNYYGTLKEPVMEMLEAGYNIILEIDVEGALNIKEKFNDAVMIFLTPPTYTELQKRLKNRATETEEIIRQRLEISKKEINYISEYDYIVINEENRQKEAAEAINSILKGEEINRAARYRVDKNKTESFIQAYFTDCSKYTKAELKCN